MMTLVTAVGSYIVGDVVTLMLARAGIVGARATAITKVSPMLLKAAKAGIKSLANKDRAATAEEIRQIEKSGAAKATMEGYFD